MKTWSNLVPPTHHARPVSSPTPRQIVGTAVVVCALITVAVAEVIDVVDWQNPRTHALGLVVSWSGVFVAGLLSGILARRLSRRGPR